MAGTWAEPPTAEGCWRAACSTGLSTAPACAKHWQFSSRSSPTGRTGRRRLAMLVLRFRFTAGEPIAARRRVAGWQEAGLARHPERPRARDYLARLVTEWIELHGDRAGDDDPAMIVGWAASAASRRRSSPASVVNGGGSGRLPQGGAGAAPGRSLELPVIALVDTPGLDSDLATTPRRPPRRWLG